MSAETSVGEVWTTRRLLAWMSEAFRRKGIDSPRLMAELLLAHALRCDKLKLYTEADRPASQADREVLRTLAARALEHEPVQYLVGEAWFFGLPFHVDRRVLIPRPSTETLVEHILQELRGRHVVGRPRGEGLLIADICTGSACIVIALLKNLPGARGVGTDICPDALEVARRNAERHGVADRLDLLEGDLLAPLRQFPGTQRVDSIDVLVSNPPYVPDDEWPAVAPNVKNHEPHKALRGGADGLDFIRRLLAEDAPGLVRPDGWFAVEAPDSRAAHVLELLRARADLADAKVLKDIDGLPRVAVAKRTNADRVLIRE